MILNEIKAIGKTLSIGGLLLLYFCAWAWSTSTLGSFNRYPKWQRILAKIFIGLHILAGIGFLIWCWI